MANYTHAHECDPCPAGFYCLQSGVPIACKKGFYCPNGTGHDLRSCPRGTYGPERQYDELKDCKPCPAGKYCLNESAITYTADCDAGHWCLSGVDRPKPVGTNFTTLTSNINYSCPFYDGLETGVGGRCPVGHFCPVGTAIPKPCQPGTYSPIEQLAACYPCMEGYYCPNENITGYTSYPCPTGHYCPNGTKTAYENACPKGTYNELTHRTKPQDCKTCKPGYYCPVEGKIIVWYHSNTYLWEA